MTHASDENRWYQRRKFWFAFGILADRRTGIERRSGAERRHDVQPASLAAGAADRRTGPTRREESERRSAERRLINRRPIT